MQTFVLHGYFWLKITAPASDHAKKLPWWA